MPPSSTGNPGKRSGGTCCFFQSTSPDDQWKRRHPLCHPERSRGICGPLSASSSPNGSAALPFVIPTGAKRSGGTCCFFNPLHQTPNGTAAVPFVIPSVAEGSAVHHPRHRIRMEAPLSPLSSRPERSGVEGPAVSFNPLHQTPDGSAAIPFVIPSVAEGSAVHHPRHRVRMGAPLSPLSSRPERSGVEGSAVQRPSHGNVFFDGSLAKGPAVSSNRTNPTHIPS
jgi:hypothetical protein